MKRIIFILGSTRKGKCSAAIGAALQKITDAYASTLHIEIIDLSDYHLPFLYESVSPMKRTEFPDDRIRKWSETVTNADGFVFIVPEYNAGYPGEFKNALDLLYKEWNKKPVMLVGYSGGPSGGSGMLKQLHEVTLALKMVPVLQEVTIPYSWKAMASEGNFVDPEHERNFKKALDQLISLLK